MEVAYTDIAISDLQYWRTTGNLKVQKRISQLLIDIQKTPFHGIGKPEPLKYQFSGCWSRRIDRENRLIYKLEANRLTVLSLKGHYLKR